MIPRTFSAYQALARQPMDPSELRAALGCTSAQARRAAQSLCDTGQARRCIRQGARGYVYEIQQERPDAVTLRELSLGAQ